ncbi:MAG: leucine-rich repeat protein [Lachnospiraceae bacterium]
MREIYGLENHKDLEELLTKAETRIKEASFDEALTHMRKALEYIIQQFVKENPECSGKDLSEMIKNLEEAEVIRKADADLLHQIRKKGNTVGAHVTGEKITKQEITDLFNRLLNYLPAFLEECPYPSSKAVVNGNNIAIDYDSIPPLKVVISKLQYEDIVYYNLADDEEDDYSTDDRVVFIKRWENYDTIKYGFVPEECFYQKRNGDLYINRAEYARLIEKRIRKITTARRQLSEEESTVCIPGILQEYFGFSCVYQDGLTPVFEKIDEEKIISELVLFTGEIRIPNSVTHFEYHKKVWRGRERQADFGEKFGSYVIDTPVRNIFLSNNLSIDSDFSWTTIVPASNVQMMPGEKGTITVQNGSVYSSDMKKLVFARCCNTDFEIPEGVETIGKNAFSCADVKNIIFPKSVRKIESSGLVNYGKDVIVIPDYIVDIADNAFDEFAKVYYESNSDTNINTQYENYLIKKEREKEEEKRRQQEYLKHQETVKKLQEEEKKRQLEEQAKRQRQLREEQARREKERKEALKKEKQAKRNRFIKKALVFVAIAAVLSLIVIKITGITNNSDKENVAANLQESAASPEKDEVIQGTTEDGLYEYTQSNGTITLTKYLGTEEEVMIPGEIDGIAVTVLGNSLFTNNTSVVSVVIPDTVIEIQAGGTGRSAFGYMDKLEKVTIPGNVKVIGSCAFIGCDILTEVILEEGIEEIGYSAFEGCYDLKEITIPESVIKLGTGCFFRTGITSITINPQCEVEGALFFGGTDGEINYYE